VTYLTVKTTPDAVVPLDRSATSARKGDDHEKPLFRRRNLAELVLRGVRHRSLDLPRDPGGGCFNASVGHRVDGAGNLRALRPRSEPMQPRRGGDSDLERVGRLPRAHLRAQPERRLSIRSSPCRRADNQAIRAAFDDLHSASAAGALAEELYVCRIKAVISDRSRSRSPIVAVSPAASNRPRIAAAASTKRRSPERR